jgi:hypothetical protein
LRCFGPARCHSLLLALVVIIDEQACAAAHFRTSLAISPEPVIADQRANTRQLTFDRIKRVNAGDLHIEFQARVLVKKVERPL